MPKTLRKPNPKRQENNDLDTLLRALQRRRIIEILVQVRTRIRELDEVVDFLEERLEN